MNYDQARPLQDGSGWHWTSRNDGIVRTAWPCKRPQPDVEFLPKDDYRPSRDGVLLEDEAWQTCAPHATREEAERHYYDASLEAVQEFGVSWTSCAVPECPDPTQKMLGNLGLGRAFNGDPLCDKHRTREQLAALHPFTPGMASIHS